MTAHPVETATAAATFAVMVVYLVSSWTYAPADLAILASAWGVWLCARHVTSEAATYALTLGMMLPVAAVSHTVLDQGAYITMLALPPLVRAGMLLSVPRRILTGCIVAARDIRWLAGGSRR